MSIELNSLMTKKERDKVETILKKASGRVKKTMEVIYFNKEKACGVDLYTTSAEADQVNSILQKAVDRIPQPREGGIGEHYLLHMCMCRKYLESESGKEDPKIKCSDYIGNGLCSGRRYNYEDDLPFI